MLRFIVLIFRSSPRLAQRSHGSYLQRIRGWPQITTFASAPMCQAWLWLIVVDIRYLVSLIMMKDENVYWVTDAFLSHPRTSSILRSGLRVLEPLDNWCQWQYCLNKTNVWLILNYLWNFSICIKIDIALDYVSGSSKKWCYYDWAGIYYQESQIYSTK